MGCVYVCDGCGKQEPAQNNGRDWVKPNLWYERRDPEGALQTACSRECIKVIAKKTGSTDLVAPF